MVTHSAITTIHYMITNKNHYQLLIDLIEITKCNQKKFLPNIYEEQNNSKKFTFTKQ